MMGESRMSPLGDSDGLGLECVGKLTSCECCHAYRQFHHSATYGGVCEIREGSVPTTATKFNSNTPVFDLIQLAGLQKLKDQLPRMHFQLDMTAL